MPNYALPNPATAQDLANIIAAIVGNFPLTPPAVTLTVATSGSTTYTYVVVAKMYGLAYPVTATTALAASTLTATNNIAIAWSALVPPIPAPSTALSAVLYDVYRTAGGTTQGKILSNLSPLQLGPLNATQLAAAGAGGNLPGGITFNSGSLNALQVIDNGIAGDGTTPPTFSSFGTIATGVVEPLQVASASGAIMIASGTVLITDTGVCALTLAQPVAGSPASGGQDGSTLLISSTTAEAHTVTCASNGISPSHHLLTFTANVTSYVTLIAYNGLWYLGPLLTVTAS
jgi:hypothetical protein